MTREEILEISKPILFSCDMVRAILDGRKTVTRRIIKERVWRDFVCEGRKVVNYLDPKTDTLRDHTHKTPYQIGDYMYVRETWYEDEGYHYKAGSPHLKNNMWVKWHPSIHMPKEATRIFLRVTDVRVERLQDMETPDDRNYLAEGAKDKHDFIQIWNSTIKLSDYEKYSWYANPYVWKIEFERVDV